MSAKPGTGIFTAMTFNVGNGLATGPRLRRYLESVHADVIGLQEVDSHQAEVIDAELARKYPHRVVRGTGFTGRAVLSRHPILEERWIESDPERPDLRVVVEIDGTAVTVVVAHTSPPRAGRSGFAFDTVTLRQIEDIAGAALASSPAVILGDFNMTTRNPAYRWLTDIGLNDAYLQSGIRPGKTLPLRIGRSRRVNRDLSWMPLRPIARVDYIWHTSEIASREAWLGEDAGSDHLPVLARLELRH